MADVPLRLFRLVDELQALGHATTADLAVRLGVSERTVRRDLLRLAELEVPVTATPGRGGGVSIEPGALLAPLRFTDAELLALVLGVRSIERLGDAGLTRAAASARRRLEAVLTPRGRARAQALDDALAGDLHQPAWSGDAIADGERVLALAEAIHDRARLSLRYAVPARPETTREIDPYGLVRLGRWYVAAYCHLRRDLRTFRLDRMRRFERTGATFERPVGVDPFALVSASIALAPAPGSVMCRVTLATDLETASRHVPASTVVLEPDPAGVQLTVRVFPDELEGIALHLLRLPWPFTVMGPDALRDALRAVARRAEARAAA
jgi:predicted DNA-binding transcriptional regulator YafY